MKKILYMSLGFLVLGVVSQVAALDKQFFGLRKPLGGMKYSEQRNVDFDSDFLKNVLGVKLFTLNDNPTTGYVLIGGKRYNIELARTVRKDNSLRVADIQLVVDGGVRNIAQRNDYHVYLGANTPAPSENGGLVKLRPAGHKLMGGMNYTEQKNFKIDFNPAFLASELDVKLYTLNNNPMTGYVTINDQKQNVVLKRIQDKEAQALHVGRLNFKDNNGKDAHYEIYLNAAAAAVGIFQSLQAAAKTAEQAVSDDVNRVKSAPAPKIQNRIKPGKLPVRRPNIPM